MKSCSIYFVCGLMVLVGCSDQDKDVSVHDKGNAQGRFLTVKSLKDDDVLVRVGTNRYTKSDFCSYCQMRIDLVKLANPDPKRKINFDTVELQSLVMYPSKVSVDAVVADYAASNSISASVGEVKNARTSILNACKKSFISWEKFSRSLPSGTSDEVSAEVGRMALKSKVRKIFLERNPVSLSDKELEDCHRHFADYNTRAAATNAVIYANASNIWAKIVGGKMTFEEAANKYNEDVTEPENGEWGIFPLSALSSDKQLVDALSNLKEGWVTPPVEGDNGLVIVKLLGIEPPDTQNPEKRYNLARIFFHMPEFVETVTKDELRVEMMKAKENKAFSTFVKNLIKAAGMKIECDEKIFKDAQQALKMPTTMF